MLSKSTQAQWFQTLKLWICPQESIKKMNNIMLFLKTTKKKDK